MAARAFPKKFTASGALALSQVVSWSVRENNAVAAPATVLLRRGTVAGDIIIAIELAANASDHAEYVSPIDFSVDDTGAPVAGQRVFVDVVSGTVDGAVCGF
jgi:hypothetical protein